jgi:class I lanthipeptide synthase
MGWEPVLDGELAQNALEAVHDIARAIAAMPVVDAPASDRALYWAYTCTAVDEPYAHAALECAIDDVVAELARAPHARLYDGGLTGMAFALTHVVDGYRLAVVDELLVRTLDVERWTGHFDLTRGLVGLGVYFLERESRDGVSRVVEHLARLAVRSDAGTCWHTPPTLLHDVFHADWPDGHHDLGLAHGTSGVIAFLARAAASVDAARALCVDAIRWLAAQRRASGRNRFPAAIAPGRPPGEAPRVAWCYGDAGVACALAMAAAHLGIAGELARDVAADCTRADANVDDTCLCHGACGLGHLLARLSHATGDGVLRAASRAWFARALAMRRDDGIAGFAQRVGDSYLPLAGICDGAMGVGLALLAACTPNEPLWDRILLANVPAR